MRRLACLLSVLPLLAACPGPADGPPGDDDDLSDDDDAGDDDDLGDDDDSVDDDDSAAPDADGDGYPADVDCDDGDPDLHPGVVPELSITDPELSLFWIGQPALVEAVPVAVTVAGCLDVAAESDAAWLVPSFTGSFVTALVDGAQVVGGIHSGTVTLRHEASGSALARFAVELRALGSPTGEHRALVVGVDGVRGDSVEPADTPAMDALRLHAAWTLEATTQLEASTVSGPGWTSILTGVDADKHGTTGNSDLEDHDPAWPTFLLRARDEGLSTAAWTSWDPIHDEIIEPGALDAGGVGDDDGVTASLAAALTGDDHDLHFLHLDDVDGAGHSGGYSPVIPSYLAAIGAADARIGVLLDAILARPTIASERWMVIVTSDHGGVGTGHGCLTWECREIPLIVAGPSVLPEPPPGFVSHMDVAPTVLDFLGLQVEEAWDLDGSIVGDPFELDCGDGLDDDGDGAVDCDDDDCGDQFSCSCPDAALGAVQGQAIVDGDTTGQGDELAGSCGGAGSPEVAFGWTAPTADTWTLDLTGSDRYFDTVLYALDGCEGAELACNDDASDVQSAITIELEQGQEVVVVVDGLGGEAGALRLNAEPLSACPDVDAGLAVGLAVASGSNLAQAGTFFASCARSGRDALVAWTAPSEGTWTLDTDGSDYDTVLHVRDGLCAGAELACDDDGLGADYLSAVEVDLAAGQQVTVVISGFNGRPEGAGPLPEGGGGNWVLNIAGP